MLRQLVVLAIHLDGMGLKEESDEVGAFLREFLEKEPAMDKSASLQGSVFMHIGGPSGSGKTSLLEKIASLYPEVICKDLDEFDEEAEKILGLKSGWKSSEKLWDNFGEDLYLVKQNLLDNFISSHSGRKIILAGIESEGEYSLIFHPQHRILLNTSAAESLSRRIRRDKALSGGAGFWDDPAGLESELLEGEKIIKGLSSSGYLPLSSRQILDFLESEMNGMDKLAAYNAPRAGKKRWSIKYKGKINCSNPKGFSQRQYCRRKSRGGKYKKV